MKKEDVVAIAGLLKITAEEVTKAIEDGGVSDLVAKYNDGNKIFSNNDFSVFQENLKRQAMLDLDKTKLPKDLYDYVKGSVLEKAEKGLAKKFGIAEFDGLDGLVDKIIETKSGTSPSEEVATLKKRITDIEAEWGVKLETERKSFTSKMVDGELRRAVDELPIDAEGVKLDNQKEIVMAMLKAKFEFSFDNDRVVANKDGKPVTDSKLDPVPVSTVIADFAKDYVTLRPDQGGRGSSSSQQGSKTINLTKYCEEHNIAPNTIAFVTTKAEFEKKGYKIEY